MYSSGHTNSKWWKEYRWHLWIGRHTFGFEYSAGHKGWRPIGFDIGLATHDDFLKFSISLFFFSIYLSWDWHKAASWLSNLIKRKDENYGSGRDIGFLLLGDTVTINLWSDPMEHRGNDPKWWHTYINLSDLVFGRAKCTTKELESHNLPIPMPEKAYPAIIKLIEYTWKRPRWPFPKSIKRCEIEIEGNEGVPFEGKGENSYDCGIDATHGMTTGKVRDVQEGVGIFVAHCLRDRIKNGGWDDWTWTKPTN